MDLKRSILRIREMTQLHMAGVPTPGIQSTRDKHLLKVTLEHDVFALRKCGLEGVDPRPFGVPAWQLCLGDMEI